MSEDKIVDLARSAKSYEYEHNTQSYIERYSVQNKTEMLVVKLFGLKNAAVQSILDREFDDHLNYNQRYRRYLRLWNKKKRKLDRTRFEAFGFWWWEEYKIDRSLTQMKNPNHSSVEKKEEGWWREFDSCSLPKNSKQKTLRSFRDGRSMTKSWKKCFNRKER